MTFLSRLFVPTQSKRLNELIGILLIASAVLMLLALASYSPLDRSLNTAANPPMGRPAHNWIGLVGAYSADLMLQSLGVAAFLLPLLVGMLAMRWLRSRQQVEDPLLKAAAAAGLLAFVSALLALSPWPLRWVHAVPIEGLLGRVLGDLLIHYLNYTGAFIVALTAIAAALYLATTFSFRQLQHLASHTLTYFNALRDRYQEWRQRRIRAREAKLLAKKQRQREMQEQRQETSASKNKRPTFLSIRSKHSGRDSARCGAARTRRTTARRTHRRFSRRLSRSRHQDQRQPAAPIPSDDPDSAPHPARCLWRRASALRHRAHGGRGHAGSTQQPFRGGIRTA